MKNFVDVKIHKPSNLHRKHIDIVQCSLLSVYTSLSDTNIAQVTKCRNKLFTYLEFGPTIGPP